MPRILFVHTQTLYSKVTIPVALRCIQDDWEVIFHVNRPSIFGFSTSLSEMDIKTKYTGVDILTPDAFRYVSRIIGLDHTWDSLKKRIDYSFFAKHGPFNFDAVVGAVKDIPLLSRFAKRDIPTFFLGYQHFPVLGRIDAPLSYLNNAETANSVFFSENAFAKSHKFLDQVKDTSYRLCNFTHLDSVFDLRLEANTSRTSVFIFHPGGYRGVLTNPGDDRMTCYRAQRLFLEKICLPILEQGLDPVIKIHPLRAQFHDLADMHIILREFESDFGIRSGTVRLIGPTAWHWPDVFSARYIVTSGSSAVYELWAAGLRNVFVCNFLGTSRSQRFDFFEEIFLETEDDLVALLGNRLNWRPCLRGLTARAVTDYARLFRGNAVQKIFDELRRV